MEVGLTDTLHDMEKIGVRRLERAALLDAMPARMAAGWEALRDRVSETGRHRFFLPEHERLCVAMSAQSWSVKDPGAARFIRNELALREEMTRQAERLDRVAGELRESVEKREEAAKSEVPFVRQEGYGDWLHPAGNAVNEAKAMLRDRKYDVHFDNRPGLKDTLRDMSDRIDRQLGAERAQWQELQRQRIATEERQSQSRGRGMSW